MRYGQVVLNGMFDKVKEQGLEVDNLLFGLAGEVGEVLDIFKKLKFHPPEFQKNCTPEALKLELGDVCWYLAGLNEKLFGEPLILRAKENIIKLHGRHPARYDLADIVGLEL